MIEIAELWENSYINECAEQLVLILTF